MLHQLGIKVQSLLLNESADSNPERGTSTPKELVGFPAMGATDDAPDLIFDGKKTMLMFAHDNLFLLSEKLVTLSIIVVMTIDVSVAT